MLSVVWALGCACASLQCNADAPVPASASAPVSAPVIAALSARSSAAATLRMRSLAATCAACHGTDGEAVAGAATPRLAGLPEDVFVLRMREFRDGMRPSTVMQQIAKGFDGEQTNALAAYFAAVR